VISVIIALQKISKSTSYNRLSLGGRNPYNFFYFSEKNFFAARGNKTPGRVNIKDVIGSYALWRKNSMSEKLAIKHTFRSNWLFEVEPFSRSSSTTLQELRDNVRLKNHLKRAVATEMAPFSLIQLIREGIRK
jgi:hypothetical protein